jgi:GPH family glycoside/pentoside/hexuronide:cation symporter
MSENKQKIGLLEKIIYGSGDVGLNAMYTLFSSYVLYFYTDVIGMNAAIIGVVILISKIFDGISDLIAGQIIDTHKSKRGHCIPVIMKWSVPMVLAVTLVFLVPDSTIAVRVAFVFVTYNLFNTIMYTYVSAAHASLASYVTNDATVRSQMMVYKMMFAALTQTIMANVILPMVEFFGGQSSQTAWIKSILVFGCVGLVFLYLNVFFVKERVDNPAPPENLLAGVKAAFQNKYWIMALIIYIFANVFLVFNMSVSVYYLNQVMGNMGLMGSWVAVCNIPGIVIGLLIPELLKKGLTQRQMVLFGGMFMLVGQIAFIALPKTVTFLLITGFIKGVGFGFPMSMCNSLVGETIDYGEWKTGTRVQGVLLGAAGVGNKIGQGLTTSLFGIFLTSVGYDGLLEAQPASAISGIDNFFQFGPLVVVIIILVTAWFFRVEDLAPQIQKDLIERRGEI